MSDWPVTLPEKMEQQGYAAKFPDGSVRTEMDAGPAYQRQRFTAASESQRGIVWLDQAQLNILRTFYITTLGHGSVAFDWKHPTTDLDVSMRFTSLPEIISTRGLAFEVSLNLEVLP